MYEMERKNVIPIMRIALFFITATFLFGNVLFCQERVITTGVPFLLITPDARAAGMGELGIATSADAYSQQWNPAKYVFAENTKGLGISYTPYLSKLVNDVFLGNLTYYSQFNDRSAWALSLKYFGLGDIQSNDFIAGRIVNQGSINPNELTIDTSYGLKLSETFSMAVALRYIRSDLKFDGDTTSANSVAVDLSGFFQSNSFDLGKNDAIFRTGFNISNVGPRLTYDDGGQRSFIPTNLKVGTGLDFIFDSSNTLGLYTEFNKLLVPTPVATYDENNNFVGYRQPDIPFLEGIFTSFSDAPGGLREELQEVTWALGIQYQYEDVFSLRTGYFNESKEKGSRRYYTIGAGFDLSRMEIDVSYLFSVSNVRNPMENTLRFSLTFNMDEVPTPVIANASD